MNPNDPQTTGHWSELESRARAVFAKFDATFGDNLEGFGGKAGMRVSW